MMISPEIYYEQYLKGKTKEQIMTAIRWLKQEIGRLKNIMEGPDYSIEFIVHPSEETRIQYTREYLGRAKEAYVEVGGIYTLWKAEEKADDFNASIDSIEKIIFSIGGYGSYVVELDDELKAYIKLLEDEVPLSL